MRLLINILFGIIGLMCISAAYAKHDSAVFKELETLEKNSRGRIGLSAIYTGNERRIQYRGNERFPMGCTAKVIGVAAILQKSTKIPGFLDETIHYSKQDATNWMPITQKHLKDGMTIRDLSAAAISYSDNTAMNLLVKSLGGIKQMNTFSRSIGDISFHQDHNWPREAMSTPFEKADSTTPLAMEKSLRKILLGDVLPPKQKELLNTWLIQNVTGNERIRAGVPKHWTVGDKTGTGFHYGTTNDVAVIWPIHCKPIVIAIYYSANQKDAQKREDLLASATKIVLNEFGKTDECIQKALTAPTKQL